MIDPTNLLPTDPAWVRKVETLAEAAAKDLGCMVVLVAVQKDGKTCAAGGGVPEAGPLAELAEDKASMLYALGRCITLQSALREREDGQK